MGYRYSLFGTAGLSRRIEKRADELKKVISFIDEIHEKISGQFEQLKKIKPKLTMLAVQVAKLKEERPRLQNLYEKNEEQVRRIEGLIVFDIDKMLGLIDKAVLLMRDITFDADTIIYREDRALSGLIRWVKRLRNIEMVNKIVFRLNTLKAEMKSLTLRLLQASELEEEEVLRYPRVKFEIPAVGIRRSGERVAELEEESFGIERIDSVIKNTMQKLKNLRVIEMKVILLMSSVDRYLDYLKSKTYLFVEDISAGVEKKIFDSVKNFENIKKDIRKQALGLYEDIEIVGEKNK